MSEPIIQFRNVSFSFGDETIYDQLSFNVEPGAFVCILGPSGCGKSTSLRLIGDLIPSDEGQVIVAGRAPKDAWQNLAYVFQSPRLVPWRNAVKNVTLAAELRFGSGDRVAREQKAVELLKLVGLENDMHKYPAALSGGERQRVSIARALAVEPQIILMDEPFSALDVKTRRRLRLELIDIWQRTRKTIVFVTHDVDEALVLADRIVVLSRKPTRVLETITLIEPRPRNVDETPRLREQRAQLMSLFEEGTFDDNPEESV
jgi:NitT/TauT family transport system ATP-binding protein